MLWRILERIVWVRHDFEVTLGGTAFREDFGMSGSLSGFAGIKGMRWGDCASGLTLDNGSA